MASEECKSCIWAQNNIDFIFCPFHYCMKKFNFSRYFKSLETEQENTNTNKEETET